MRGEKAKKQHDDDRVADRERMVEKQIAGRDVTMPRVLEAVREVPRHLFVPPAQVDRAYLDAPLPIGSGQTISQPYIVAFMIEASGLADGETALEIGAGSGYAAAVMSRIAGYVYAVERLPDLARQAKENLRKTGYDNVEIIEGDGSRGYEAQAPYDVIIVSAGGPRVPESLKRQLKPGGRLIIPIGRDDGFQDLIRVTGTDDDNFNYETIAGVSFVPLIGDEGWSEYR